MNARNPSALLNPNLPVEMEDCAQAYGDAITVEMTSEASWHCHASADGEHTYQARSTRCIHCGRESRE